MKQLYRTKADLAAHQAIQDENVEALRAALKKRTVTEDSLHLPVEIMRWGHPEAVTLAGQYFRGKGLARAVALLLEEQKSALANLLITHADAQLRHLGRPALDRHQALGEAISADEPIAMEALMAMGATLEGLARLNMRPLEEVAIRGHLRMLEKLLPLIPDTSARDDALLQAVQCAAHESVFPLWEVASSEGRGLALHAAAHQMRRANCWQEGKILAALLARTPATAPVTDTVHQAATQAMRQAMGNQNWEVVNQVLPWADAKHEQSLLLREAIVINRQDLVKALLPRSDLVAARQAWAQARPPRWDMIDRLATLAPAELRQAWLADKKNGIRLGQALATDRAEKAVTIEPPVPRARPRRRS
jgi:hypothetical protein